MEIRKIAKKTVFFVIFILAAVGVTFAQELRVTRVETNSENRSYAEEGIVPQGVTRSEWDSLIKKYSTLINER
jgi:hypothetical protein